MSKNLKRALMDVPTRPELAIEEITPLRESTFKRTVFAIAAMLVLFLGGLFIHTNITTEKTTTETLTDAEDIESELLYIMDYFNGEDVDEVFDEYTLSFDF